MVKARRVGKCRKGSKKPQQSAHNKETGKYVRQRIRTARNKAKRIKKHN